ncbi:hypothetical protein SASPL_153347 [Salvia splendens]|uniref:Disease resistance R13L4/SHOC-2-like LRR domain-containing protein n=1 Tax=Salvia splendens TaxID=180675 RepID=A0A8X8W4T3_SALSN|nr:hypothetical protein SASPL_153347 [Salvia splendens]
MNPEQYSSALHQFNQIRCINELFLLLEFTDFPQREARIRDAAIEVQQILELLISKQSRSRFGLNKYNRFLAKFWRSARFQHQIERIRELIDAIAREMIELEKDSEDQLQLSDSPSAIEVSDSCRFSCSKLVGVGIGFSSSLAGSVMCPLQEMRFMDIEQSWELLMQRVFGDEDCSPELESIGLKIARSCGGLPLAVSVIGGLLSMVERNPVSWLEIADNVENDYVGPLPDALYKLFALRYLATNTMHNFRIPAVISKLQNLQTLIIDARHSPDVGRPNINSLPQEIWLMPQLRHLICYGRFPCPKEPTCTLKNLQTLSLVLHDMCVVEILENIPNIKKLGVDCSYYDYGTHLNNLEYLHQLQSLELRCADWRKDSISFRKMLRKLILCNMSLPWSEMSIVGSLPNLEVLKLKKFACIGSTWETSEGEFLQLQ